MKLLEHGKKSWEISWPQAIHRSVLQVAEHRFTRLCCATHQVMEVTLTTPTHPSQIARETYYFDRAVQGTLLEMSKSGLFQIRASIREKHYWLKRDLWAALLGRTKNPLPKWINWPALFSALERVWIRLHDPQLVAATPFIQSSELRQLMVEIFPAFQRSGFDRSLSDPQNHLGEAYLTVFMSDLRQLLESLSKAYKLIPYITFAHLWKPESSSLQRLLPTFENGLNRHGHEEMRRQCQVLGSIPESR